MERTPIGFQLQVRAWLFAGARVLSPLVFLLFPAEIPAEDDYWKSRPGGCAGASFAFPEPASGGFDSVDFHWRVTTDPGKDFRAYPVPRALRGESPYVAYFWANQFDFTESGGGGYCGLQTIGVLYDGDTSNEDVRIIDRKRMVIFSIWNALDGRDGGPGSTAKPFGHEGSGWSCKRIFDWSADRDYRIRVEALPGVVRTNGVDAIWWRGSVQDRTAKSTKAAKVFVIGDVLLPKKRGQLKPKVSMFAEYYGQTVGDRIGLEDAEQKRPRVCDYMPLAEIQVGLPVANAASDNPVACSEIRVNPYGKCAHRAAFLALDNRPLANGKPLPAQAFRCRTGTLQPKP